MPTNIVKPLQWWDYNRDDPLADDAAAAYPIWEGMGPQVQDVVNDHHGTINGATWVATEMGPGLDYNGSTSHVSIDSIWRAFPSNNLPFTIAAWIRPTTVSVQHEWVDIGNGCNDDGTPPYKSGFRLLQVAGDMYGQIMDGSTRYSVIKSGGVTANVWQHAVFTYDLTDGKLFSDGAQVASAVLATWATHTEAYLGQQADSDVYFAGQMADVVIYTRALSAAEIADQYRDRCRLFRPRSSVPYALATFGADEMQAAMEPQFALHAPAPLVAVPY